LHWRDVETALQRDTKPLGDVNIEQEQKKGVSLALEARDKKLQTQRFTFEDIEDYMTLGNASLNKNEAIHRRQCLKRDRLIQSEIAKYWNLFPKGKNGNVSRKGYCAVHARICRALLPDISPE
jgi:hypothetical protein